MFFYSSGSSYHIALASIAKYSNAKAQDVLCSRVNLDRGALIKIEYQRWFSLRCFIPACWNRYTKLSLSSIPAHLRTRSTCVNNKKYWQFQFLVYKHYNRTLFKTWKILPRHLHAQQPAIGCKWIHTFHRFGHLWWLFYLETMKQSHRKPDCYAICEYTVGDLRP